MRRFPASVRRIAAAFCLLAGSASLGAAPIDDLVQATVRDDLRSVERLLREGVDPNQPDAQGRLALVTALQEASPRSVKALLQSGRVDLNARNRAGETALMMAALKGELELCRQLLETGAAADHEGWTPLHYAAAQEESRIVELLLARGVKVDAESPNRTTPLMMAAGYGSEEAVRLLLKAGADPTRRNAQGLDPADFATKAGRDKLAAAFEDLKRRRAARTGDGASR